jgi:hypothetical protein
MMIYLFTKAHYRGARGNEIKMTTENAKGCRKWKGMMWSRLVSIRAGEGILLPIARQQRVSTFKGQEEVAPISDVRYMSIRTWSLMARQPPCAGGFYPMLRIFQNYQPTLAQERMSAMNCGQHPAREISNIS